MLTPSQFCDNMTLDSQLGTQDFGLPTPESRLLNHNNAKSITS